MMKFLFAKAADKLINEIVYRLYGLIGKEIKVVRQMIGMIDFHQPNCDNGIKYA